MELFYSDNKPRLLQTKRPRPVYVVGADMDLELVRALVPQDQVLMEANGVRFSSKISNPLVADQPWEVVENTIGRDANTEKRYVGQLVLKHPNVPKPLVLNYAHLDYDNLSINSAYKPAVWVTTAPEIMEGALCVILQMVAYRLSEDRVDITFPPRYNMQHFKYTLADETARAGMLQHWHDNFKNLSVDGWALDSINRFSLRSGVRVETLLGLHRGDWDFLAKVSDEDFCKMRKECHWLKYLIRQNKLISHDVNKVFVKNA